MDDPGQARRLDELAARALPAALEARIDGWWCRANPVVPFRRCNVALPPTGATADPAAFEAALSAVGAWYRARDQRLIVAVSTADGDAVALDGRLGAHGLVVEAPVEVLVATLPLAAVPGRRAPVVVSIADPGTASWAERADAVHGGDDRAVARTMAYGRLLAGRPGALGALAVLDGAPVGVGFAVVDGAWVGIFGMATAPHGRRRGVARAVLAGLLEGAAERGATRAYLQVEADNAPALGLYRSLGFRTDHRYHYRAAPLGSSAGG